MTSIQPGESELARNRLLAPLPPDELARLAAHARIIDARRGMELYAPGQQVESVVFPCGAIVSLVVVMPDGRTAEAGLVGPEGSIGGLATSAPHPAFARAVVQIPGRVASIDLAAIEAGKARSPALRDAMARYADCFVAQLLQTIACNVLHPLEKRLARWLLTVRYLHGLDELPLTQEYLAEMLGVQRTTVTLSAASLQERGLISYARGRIRILDADGLQDASCRCHLPVRMHYERVLQRSRTDLIR